MTKKELINVIRSIKIDLKYLKKDLQFRLEGNDIDGILKKYDDSYASKAGAFQAHVMMDNDTFKRSIISIDKIMKELENK